MSLGNFCSQYAEKICVNYSNECRRRIISIVVFTDFLYCFDICSRIAPTIVPENQPKRIIKSRNSFAKSPVSQAKKSVREIDNKLVPHLSRGLCFSPFSIISNSFSKISKTMMDLILPLCIFMGWCSLSFFNFPIDLMVRISSFAGNIVMYGKLKLLLLFWCDSQKALKFLQKFETLTFN